MPTRPRRFVLLLALAALALPAQGWGQGPAGEADAGELGSGIRLKFVVAHPFSRADAKARIGQMLEYWSKRFGVTSEWTGDRVRMAGHLFGVPFRGYLDVGDSAVSGEASDPGVLLRASASDYIRGKLRKYLSPTYEES